MKIKILHNMAERPLRMLEGYEDGDALVHVFDLEPPAALFRNNVAVREVPGLREWTFMVLNVGEQPRAVSTPEGNFVQAQAIAYRKRKNRSLSVGDVIVINDQAWACDTVGWKQVTVHDHQIVKDVRCHGTTPIEDAPDLEFERQYEESLR